MPRYSIYRNTDGIGYLLDVQANLLNHLNTRMVVPLLPASIGPQPAQTLNPLFDLEGEQHVMATQFMAAVPARILKEPVDRAEHRAFEITAALDCLFQGV